MNFIRHTLLYVSCLLLITSSSRGEVVHLSNEGVPLLPVIVADKATDRVQQAAKVLSQYLRQISGADFKVSNGDGQSGIAVGTVTDFPELQLDAQFEPGEITRREEYLLKSHSQGLLLIGASELAVEHAVWDLLYRLGYRQYFPGETWEIVPDQPSLSIDVEEFERPDYLSRRIWYGYGFWEYNNEPYQQWCARNRCVPGIQLSTGHAYDRVVKIYRDEFESHPEYWPQLDGIRQAVKNPKPCMGNSGVRALFVKSALDYFEKNPQSDSLSMDPSDGGGWCECEKCARLGSVSDQVVTVANEVAAAIEEKHSGKLVGIYAYNYHASPPSIRVHPNVVVSVATAFIKGDLSLEQIITGWSEQGATLGIREYYSVNVWDRDQPAQALGGNLNYLKRTIPEFHSRGVRFMSAESSDNWGPNGLGYYLAAHMLWNVDDSQQLDVLIDDFLERAFGQAQEPMREYYQQLDGSNPHMLVEDQFARMFLALDQARLQADKPEVRKRIDQLVLYTHYCSLFHQYSIANGADRQSAFEALLRHAYQMRSTMLIHTKALYRDLARRDLTVNIPEGAGWNIPEERNPWKSEVPFEEEGISSMLKQGLADYQPVDIPFEPVSYSDDLVPAADYLQLTTPDPEGSLGVARGLQSFYTYAKNASTEIELFITADAETKLLQPMPVKIKIWKIGGESEAGERETLTVSKETVLRDQTDEAIKIPIKEQGLYRVDVDSEKLPIVVTFKDGQTATIRSTGDSPISDSYKLWRGFFYVPRGTKIIGLVGGDSGEIRDSQGRRLLWLNARQRDFYSVPVPTGEDGKLWEARYVNGDLRLLTVPPLFSTTSQGLLLPREVIQKEIKE
ncbi:hypothetical protein Pla110_17980 [Polystyrenella longa]|uniref:Alpha glucuronidase N-terminal domain-containing protein n=1 Tax=Polystyrenella longa TaxID=2528007 RepID=A0A518CLH9_9PLAN|nr:DUF4838 domain-containing protein [Polystyrenella longa]QDU80076.1 hypothetical protein Pla110_17980 [Polystyrenella longa]